MLAVLGVTALAVVGAWGTAPAGAAGDSRPTRHPGPTRPTLTLLAPPSIAGPSSPFALRLGVSGAVARTDLTLGVSVYRCMADPSEFDETLGGSPVGAVVARSGAIALSSLTADPEDTQGGVDLTVPVTTGGTPGAGTGPFTADLTGGTCQPGTYGGVYPVQLELTDTVSRTVTSRLLTYLVYTDPSADIEPLRFALVVPLALARSTGPAGVPSLTSPSLTSLVDAMGAVSGAVASVPVTLAPIPATVAALAGDQRARAKAALATMISLTAAADRQTLCGPFVPVDVSALVSATLGGATELDDQVRRGAEALAVLGLHGADCSDDEVWVADTTLDAASLAALDRLGYSDVVVPPDAVTGPPLSTTPTRLFTLEGSPHPGNAVLSDPVLSARLQPGAHGDPALAADQILAGLELDYYEAPNTAKARGVVAVPPASEPADPAVVADVLAGLAKNPMVDAVTLGTLFSEVPVGGTTGGFPQPSNRRPAAVGASGLPESAIAAARAQLTGFSAAVAGSATGTAVADALDDELLQAESQDLSSAQQRAGVAHFEDALRGQLALLSITSRDVRLTARTGSVPITVVKNAPYPVQAVLTVTSDKIAFSGGGAQVPNTECRSPVVTNAGGRSSVSTLCTFMHGTNAVYIEMRSRVSGDFRMSVTLDSPQTGLELASGQLTVRSMSTSAVAIALSVAAVAVLLTWWGRTMWRNRRTRRGAHSRRGGGGS